MQSFVGDDDDAGSRVLNDLQFIDEFGGETGEEGIAVINAGGDK